MHTKAQTPPPPESSSYPWGIARSWRGLKYHEIATEFIEEYPIGTVFVYGSELVDIGRRLFRCPPEAYRAPSYYARRLTISGTHPRMGERVFAVRLASGGLYQVEDPLESWQNFDMADVLEKKFASVKRYQDYKLQGKSFPDLPNSLQKSIRRVYTECQRIQEVNAVLHGPLIEALEDLKGELDNYKE